MLRRIRRILKSTKGETGAALVEYALLVAGIALIGAASIAIFGHKTNDMIAMVAAVIPGAHTDDNAPIVSGKIIETAIGTNNGLDSTDTAKGGIGLDVATIIAASDGTQRRLGNNVGAADTGGSLADLVLEANPTP
jgi:pilus assembly protein Flp/PilA